MLCYGIRETKLLFERADHTLKISFRLYLAESPESPMLKNQNFPERGAIPLKEPLT